MKKILKMKKLIPNFNEMVVYHPYIAKKARGGQFVIVRADEKGERIPLSISDYNRDEGTITIVFEEAGVSTRKLAMKKEEEVLPTLTGPLGMPSVIEKFGKVLLIGGCYGIGAIYPLEKELKEMGNTVIVGIEARSSAFLFWREKHINCADAFYPLTRDGSEGLRGHVDTIIDAVLKDFGSIDRIFAIGCTLMMKKVAEKTKPLGIKTIVNLNPIMIDGTGMCGVCRVNVGGKMKFACVDGPDFDAHEVDWDVLIMRKKAYLDEELTSLMMMECMKDF
jgi:ferredoxin--NADP+ reductase